LHFIIELKKSRLQFSAAQWDVHIKEAKARDHLRGRSLCSIASSRQESFYCLLPLVLLDVGDRAGDHSMFIGPQSLMV